MAKLRKFTAYTNLKRPYTRISKFTKKNFVRGGFPYMKIIKWDMGNQNKEYDLTLRLLSMAALNVRHNALESGRQSCNRLLEKTLGGNYHLRLKVYPFHVLREHSLAAGAGADRMSTGMQKPYGKPVGSAARVAAGQTLMELRIDRSNLKLAKDALVRAAKKFPCACKVVVTEQKAAR